MKHTAQPASQSQTKIQWPAILIHMEDDELVYLKNEQDWELEAQGHIDDLSHLFDSSGVSFCLKLDTLDANIPNKHLSWIPATEPISLAQVLSRIRQHASTLGHCCTAKLGANTVEQAFEIIKYLDK